MGTNYTSYYTPESIDNAIETLRLNEHQTKITSIELIKMIKGDEELSGMCKFYSSILESIFNQEKMSYPEKEEFLILHKSLLEVYNNNKI